MAGISVKNLTFRYPKANKPALDGLSIDIADGSFVLICGRNGCGKTTLLRHLKSVLMPYGQRSGKVFLDEKPLEEMPHCAQAAMIGYVAQDPDAQIVADKVWHELAFGLECLGVPQDEMRSRVAEMAVFFGLDGIMNANVNELSGGQKQLVNLAGAMAGHPEILLLDEPTVQLDPVASNEFIEIIRRLNRELGLTVVMVEQRLEEAFAVADEVAVMDSGRMIYAGAPKDAGAFFYERNEGPPVELSTPMRVFYGINSFLANDGAGSSSTSAIPAVATTPTALAAPITVREGRMWLKNFADAAHAKNAMRAESKDAVHDESAVAIEFDDVWFRYSRNDLDVLHGLSFAVHKGTLHAILGGNGAGKSTALKLACGLLRPYRGEVRVLSRPIRGWKGGFLGKTISMLPQDPTLIFVAETVRGELKEMLAPENASSDEAISKIADDLQIAHLMDSHPHDLSRGEAQRVALAKLLLLNPHILLLDEPTRGLDHSSKNSLAIMLRRMNAEGRTIVIVSHDVEFCAQHADEVTMIFDGEATSSGSPQQFFASNVLFTTAASRMSRGILDGAITAEDIIDACVGTRMIR